ncbi:MAG: acyl--CoA ligase [Deltaproteobacteria bacterium]|nr:acyl--CoA ligase [Deltaproteobacteria bacterium]
MTNRLTREDIFQKDLELLGESPADIVQSLPDRISHRIRHWETETPDNLAVLYDGRPYTYREFMQLIEKTKLRLVQLGVRRGDRVMLVCENALSLMCLTFALSELDAWAVIINARLGTQEIDSIFNHCDPRLILFTTGISREAGQHAERFDAEEHFLSDLDETRVSKTWDCQPETVFESGAEQVFVMIYTTGTTGAPKGVMLTHHNIGYIASITGRLRQTKAGDRIYAVLPISHVFGLSSVVMSAFFAGACVLPVPRFSTARVIYSLASEGVTMLFGVPTLFVKLLEFLKESHSKLDIPVLRMIYAGGSPLDPTVKAEIERKFHLPLHNGYGLTEGGPTLSQTRAYEPAEDNSVGPLLPGIETHLRNENSAALTQDEGELWVRGPNVMKGYFRAPDLTAIVKKDDGWLNTGDVARLDASGNLYISGRTKELIIHSGFNVYPQEVESAINSHPDVSVSAVIGNLVDGDEEIVAFVKLMPSRHLDTVDLTDYLKGQLTPYKRPGRIIFMDEMPASPSGKILLAKLKEQVQEIL